MYDCKTGTGILAAFVIGKRDKNGDSAHFFLAWGRKSYMTPRQAEKAAKSWLEKKYNQPFDQNVEIKIGPNKWRFDLVSKDKKIVAEVKSRQAASPTEQQFITIFKRGFIFDCLKLERIRARKKYFFLAADKELFDRFKEKAKGLISQKVEFHRL